MNDPRLEILVWPGQLAHILERLELGTHQDFHRMRTDAGSILQRPVNTPTPIFKATVSLSQAEEAALMEFFHASQGRHFSFQNPETQSQVYATFMEAPFYRRQTMTIGSSHTTREVEMEIVLKDTTQLIEEAIKHGVVSSPSL